MNFGTKGQRAINYQHVGPFGEYRRPAHPLFRWDPLSNKTLSLSSEVVLFDEDGGGRDEAHYTAVFKLGQKVFRLWTILDEEYDIEGKQFFHYRNNRKVVANKVYKDVYLREGAPSASGSYPYEFIPSILTTQEDPRFGLVMDYLSVPRDVINPRDGRIIPARRVAKIIFNDEQTITPKSFLVI